METRGSTFIYINDVQSFVYSVVVDVPEDHLFLFLWKSHAKAKITIRRTIWGHLKMAITSISGIHLCQHYSNSLQSKCIEDRTVGKCIFKSIRYLHAPKSNKQHQSLIIILY